MNTDIAKHYLADIYARYEQLRGFGDMTGAVYERIIESLYSILLSPGDGAVDLGACVGMHTLPMARAVGPTGKVLAFEPLTNCREFVRKSAVAAGLASRLDLQACAISNSRGTAKFFEMSGAITGHSGLRKKPEYPGSAVPQEIQVTTKLLDDFLPLSQRVGFIKADLEGGEFHAMQGGRELLRQHRPVVVMESSLKWDAQLFGYNPADFFAYFADLKYSLKDILGCPFHPLATEHPYPHYVVAFPSERTSEVDDALAIAILKNTLAPTWFGLPASTTGATPSTAGTKR